MLMHSISWNTREGPVPPRNNPTLRQRRLGAELRKMREGAGMTAREVAGLLGSTPIQMSQVESGRAGISESRLRRLAALYDCDARRFVDALVDMAGERGGGTGWWEKYRGVLPVPLLDLSELEHHASYLRTIQITHFPGTFQTEDYARTIFGHVIPELPAPELEARVAHRLERRSVFAREAPPKYDVVIHEAALRMRFGGRKIARGQLDHLLELSEAPHIEVRVVPFEAAGHIASGHAMFFAGGPVQQLDTVQIDGRSRDDLPGRGASTP